METQTTQPKHWSEKAQEHADRLEARNRALFRAFVFRDLGAQAGRMYLEQVKAKQ